jgi:hypothetical protein
METQKTKGSRGIWVLGILIVVVLVAFGAYHEKSAIYSELSQLKLIPEQERFTELYFNDASSLPRQTNKGVVDTFSFTIHNVEYATTTYPYRVYFVYPSGRQVPFATSTITLTPNASTTVNISHTWLASNEHGQVVVELTSLNQSIDFLLPDTN